MATGTGRMADRESRFLAYVQRLAEALGHADRAGPLRAYCTGLLLPGERKSVEPMAAKLAPRRVGAAHQAMHHFVAKAPWDDWAMLAAVRDWVLPRLTARGRPLDAWILDDTGIPKKGRHSLGVARQYCGQVGKQDNCQVAVSLSLAAAGASLPIAWRLYLPKEWVDDPARRGAARRAAAGIPAEIGFATKPAIALGQIEAALAAGVPRPEAVVMDAGYGADTDLRDALTSLGLSYVAGVMGSASFRPADYVPLPPKPYGGQGRRPSRLRQPPGKAPTAARDLAFALPAAAWRTVTWREGMRGRFAAFRVRPAHRDAARGILRPVEWLLVEWPKGEAEPTKYFLSTLPERTSLRRLVHLAKLRWRIERDFEDLKQEVGLGHYEGRGWRGFHHHATVAIAAYGFLVAERAALPPSARRWRPKAPGLPPGFAPRGRPAPA
jgi:SRSO17 transposase